MESTAGHPEIPSPCRLNVFLARTAPIGVVLRRGPADWARLSVWHTDTDRFEHGQWIRARIYERRSDLSADGSLFAYFARKSSQPFGRDTWVAVSRPPHFTALALWFIGGTYYTGGFFPDGGSLWLGFKDTTPDEGSLSPELPLTTETPAYVETGSEWTERTVHVNRLLRDGWSRVEHEAIETWERADASGRVLRVAERVAYSHTEYGGRYILEFSLRTTTDEPTQQIGRATWADWDHGGRLVLARDGRLLHWTATGELDQIEDFNPQKPDPAPSPAWARRWP